MREKAFLLDVDHVQFQGKPAIRLLLKRQDGVRAAEGPEGKGAGAAFRLYDTAFEPYFFVKPAPGSAGARERLAGLKVLSPRGELMEVKRVEDAVKRIGGREEKVLKVFACHPQHVPKLREAAKPLGETFEYAVNWAKRWLIDRAVTPSSLVEVEYEGLSLKSVKQVDSDEAPAFRMMAFDIETYNPLGVPDPSKDPCLMISHADEKEAGVLSHSKKFSPHFVKSFPSEKDMLEGFCSLLREKHVDLLCGYNSDVFDLPYMTERAKKLRADFRPGRDKGLPATRQAGLRQVTRVGGRVHFDVYATASFLQQIGALRLPRLTLEKVFEELVGGGKEMVKKSDIYKMWDAGGEGLEELAKYCRSDSIACLKLAEQLLPLEVELSRVSGETLFDAIRSTTGQLVESLLIRRAFARNEMIPNKPRAEEISARSGEPIKGAFVKRPEAGVYENIAVLDFRSLYPSIIISHNIDPATLDCKCCADAFVAPERQRFCRKQKGLIPETLKQVLESRKKVIEEMKRVKRDSDEYRRLGARKQSLKILANSFYGYLLYARSRWYSRECGEAVTAWGRSYIQEMFKKAEEAGFKVLYGDTDALFIQFKAGEEGKVIAFKEKINKELPEAMELELEDFYPRGIFVAKKQEAAKGAKKKYALINKEGKIKIRGFELVRRDWSRVARETQREVLEILLREGDLKKALELVRNVVKELKAGKTPLEDLVIYTQLRKAAGAYEIKSPEVSAFLHAKKAGHAVQEGAVIGYVITTKGKSISEKAQLVELAKDYDPDYYVENQVLPAVLKILGAMGVSADDLKTNSSQKGLGDW
ncbi:MAG: DNA-directed DNA polymerase [Candidatus Micrarchaeota archaeon]|nr:DNA-directed DNA polymerase [Candidatus Micrarchaeota archaeon]